MQLDRNTLLEAYRKMRLIRVFEERVNNEFYNGNIPGFVHLYVGQEASATGICAHLNDGDVIGSTHRGHGHTLAKGCDVEGMMLEIFGKAGGLCGGKGGSMHIADLDKGMLGANGIVGGNAPLAVGAALSAKTLKTGGVSVAFIGDGASNQGTVFEAMNLAVVLQLPAIFVIENNGYAEGTGFPYHCGSKDVAARARAFGMPAIVADGTDVFAVYDAMGEAVARARNGGGPTTIETQCTRFYGHFAGDPQLYRSKEEVEAVRETHDPLPKFRARVTSAGLLESAQLDAIDKEVDEMIERAAARALAAPAPAADTLTTDVYISY